MPQKPTIEIQCKYCNASKMITKQQFKKGASYCSAECAYKGRANYPKKTTIVECALCKIQFEKETSRLKNSKSGLYFCSKEHKIEAQRVGGIKEIQPYHYGNGKTKYKNKAFRYHEHKCNRCGYNKFKEVLQVHHIDRNHDNVSINNLEILCPTCHAEEHYVSKN